LQVEVTANRDGKDNNRIKIEMLDNGPGIAPEINGLDIYTFLSK